MQYKTLTVLLAAVISLQTISALDWNDFRLTFGPTPNGFFNRVPKTTRDPLFTQQNWKILSSDCKNGNTFHGYQALVPGDYGIALLFDVNGVIAGIQQLLNKTQLLVAENNVNYPRLPVYQTQTFDNQEFFVITVYFTNPSLICRQGRLDIELKYNGTANTVLIQNGTNPQAGLVEIPRNRNVAVSQGWNLNQCFQAMGQHNFYGVDKYQSHNCTEVFPFFGLYTHEGELLGFGFSGPGTSENWRFEHPPGPVISRIIGVDITPQCVLDSQATIGLTSAHVYFIDEPWKITC